MKYRVHHCTVCEWDFGIVYIPSYGALLSFDVLFATQGSCGFIVKHSPSRQSLNVSYRNTADCMHPYNALVNLKYRVLYPFPLILCSQCNLDLLCTWHQLLSPWSLLLWNYSNELICQADCWWKSVHQRHEINWVRKIISKSFLFRAHIFIIPVIR